MTPLTEAQIRAVLLRNWDRYWTYWRPRAEDSEPLRPNAKERKR